MRICSYRPSFKGGMRQGGVKPVAWMLLLLLVVDVIVMRRRVGESLRSRVVRWHMRILIMLVGIITHDVVMMLELLLLLLLMLILQIMIHAPGGVRGMLFQTDARRNITGQTLRRASSCSSCRRGRSLHIHMQHADDMRTLREACSDFNLHGVGRARKHGSESLLIQ